MDDADAEVPVAELVDALGMPRQAVARWMDHLDRFFARHGGAARYGGLGRLTAETRAAVGDDAAAVAEKR